MREYVLMIVSRDPEHPLAETMLLESGFDDAPRLVAAVEYLSKMLNVLKTPERLAQFMRDNASLASAPTLRR